MKKKFQLEVPGGADKVLLHTCCAPCSSAIIECMMQHHITPVIYYCNPNIYPLEEYMIRKDECTRYAQSLGLEIIDADYDHENWRCHIAGMEQEPERGGRCLRCFKLRLLETYWEQNWRKGGLSERRIAIIKEYNFYNQQYCGCEFSMRKEE